MVGIAQPQAPSLTQTIEVYSDGSVKVIPATNPVPPIVTTMPSIVVQSYIPTTSPSKPWPTTNTTNPSGEWKHFLLVHK